MTTINLNGKSKITSSLEVLAAAQVAAGRTSGTLAIYLNGTKVTYNNMVVSSSYRITFTSSGYSIASIS